MKLEWCGGVNICILWKFILCVDYWKDSREIFTANQAWDKHIINIKNKKYFKKVICTLCQDA